MLKIDWITHEAAKYAVENWHYSRNMPHGKLVKLGVWEDEAFIGAVIFGSGANSTFGNKFGLTQFEVCELVRIALRAHKSPVTQIVSIALRMLKKGFPKLRLVFSFADPNQNHKGGIYQAGNWIYTGRSIPANECLFQGKRWHWRALGSSLKRKQIKGASTHFEKAKALDPEAKIVLGSSKFRYLMPLDEEMREKILPLKKPYPSADEVTPGDTSSSNSKRAVQDRPVRSKLKKETC